MVNSEYHMGEFDMTKTMILSVVALCFAGSAAIAGGCQGGMAHQSYPVQEETLAQSEPAVTDEASEAILLAQTQVCVGLTGDALSECLVTDSLEATN
jgi:hypothetical protein